MTNCTRRFLALPASVSFGGDRLLLAVALRDEPPLLDVALDERLLHRLGAGAGEDLVVLRRPGVVGVALHLDARDLGVTR